LRPTLYLWQKIIELLPKNIPIEGVNLAVKPGASCDYEIGDSAYLNSVCLEWEEENVAVLDKTYHK
jgi:hypothetical protein